MHPGELLHSGNCPFIIAATPFGSPGLLAFSRINAKVQSVHILYESGVLHSCSGHFMIQVTTLLASLRSRSHPKLIPFVPRNPRSSPPSKRSNNSNLRGIVNGPITSLMSNQSQTAVTSRPTLAHCQDHGAPNNNYSPLTVTKVRSFT